MMAEDGDVATQSTVDKLWKPKVSAFQLARPVFGPFELIPLTQSFVREIFICPRLYHLLQSIKHSINMFGAGELPENDAIHVL